MPVPTAPLPVITTHLLERRERGYLAWVAVANEIVELPLESPPIDASTHALEIHVAGFEAPLVVLAEPMGAPTTVGFPLRLRPLDEDQEDMLRMELFSGGAHEGRAQGQRDERPSPKASGDPSSQTISHATTPLGARQKKTDPPTRQTLTEPHALALAKMTGPSTLSRRAPGSLQGRPLGDGRFVLDRLIGGGASGEVYRAVHAALRRAVAVKVLHPTLQRNPDYCTRFYVEALAASQLDHRNVLRVLDYGQEPDGLLYIVMDLLEGESLQHLIDTEGRLSEERIVDLITQACAGLAHAHDAGVIHRDIKPENIVIVKGRDDDGRETELVKVCDFGIAHWEKPAAKSIGNEDALEMPDASKIVGTPMYMSPEQIENDTVDARADVYSLGVVLYELATGQVPFMSDDALELLRAHLIETPIPPSRLAPEISKDLERIILKALEKEPAKRQRDARELRAELRRLVDDEASNSGMFRKVSIRMAALSASDFVTDTADALATLHDIHENDRPSAYAALGEALRDALLGGRPKLARDLVAWLHTRVADPGLPEAERTLAQRAMNVLRDPEVARAHAINILDGKLERTDDALSMLRAAGPLAARVLIDARRVRAPSLELRGQFVATMLAIGSPTLPVILSALEPLTAVSSRQDEALAEDLLRATPDARSDEAGDVMVRFVRLDKPALGIAALRATTLVWGFRARPLLVGVLDAPHDSFRLLALEELQKLGCIDDAVVERIGRILLGQYPTGDDLKLAAASSLASATPDARPRAIAIAIAKLTPTQGLMSSIRSALGPREHMWITLALARALHVLDPGNSSTLLERLAHARPELRPHVDGILTGR